MAEEIKSIVSDIENRYNKIWQPKLALRVVSAAKWTYCMQTEKFRKVFNLIH